jgi:hypothetical protein
MGAEPGVGPERRIKGIPVWPHSLPPDQVIDGEADRKKHDHTAQEESRKVETLEIEDQIQ